MIRFEMRLRLSTLTLDSNLLFWSCLYLRNELILSDLTAWFNPYFLVVSYPSLWSCSCNQCRCGTSHSILFRWLNSKEHKTCFLLWSFRSRIAVKDLRARNSMPFERALTSSGCLASGRTFQIMNWIILIDRSLEDCLSSISISPVVVACLSLPGTRLSTLPTRQTEWIALSTMFSGLRWTWVLPWELPYWTWMIVFLQRPDSQPLMNLRLSFDTDWLTDMRTFLYDNTLSYSGKAIIKVNLLSRLPHNTFTSDSRVSFLRTANASKPEQSIFLPSVV